MGLFKKVDCDKLVITRGKYAGCNVLSHSDILLYFDDAEFCSADDRFKNWILYNLKVVWSGEFKKNHQTDLDIYTLQSLLSLNTSLIR